MRIESTMSHHLQAIYDVWDGNADAMASDIDELGVTVRQWRNRGEIPSRAWPKIIKAALDRRGRRIGLADFLPPSVRDDLPPHAVCDTGAAPAPSSGKPEEISDSAAEASSLPFSQTSSRNDPAAGTGEVLRPVPCSGGPTPAGSDEEIAA